MPIFTDHDLETIKPSELLRKAHEAYPEIRCDWVVGYKSRWHNYGSCCPAMLIAHAAGRVMYSHIPYGGNISRATHGCETFPEAIEVLRREGL